MATIVLGDDGVITLDGTVQGMDFAALRNAVVNHHAGHTIAAGTRSDTHSETLQTDKAYYTATDSNGSNAAYRYEYQGRSHDHALNLTVATTVTSTSISPSGSQVLIDHIDGHITCRTIDGYAPEEIYARFRNHTHGYNGGLATETLPIIYLGYYYYIYIGGSWQWRLLRTAAGPHSHDVGSLALDKPHSADAPAPPIGTIGAGYPKVALRKATGNIEMKGRVNTIGISTFYSYYINHYRHLTTGVSGPYGPSSAQLFDLLTGAAAVMNDGGSGYVVSAQHTHSVPGYVVSSPA